MKRCNCCGKMVEDDVNYCPNCGLTYFSSCDTGPKTDHHAETYEENKPKYGKQDEISAPNQRNLRLILIGTTAAAAVLISVFVLIFLSDTGKFRIPAFNYSADADNMDEENQEVVSAQETVDADEEVTADVTQQMNEDIMAQEADETAVHDAGLYVEENDAVSETGTAEDGTLEVYEPITVIDIKIPEDGVEVTYENRNKVALSRLMSISPESLGLLAFTDEYPSCAGVRCIAELPEYDIRVYGYYDTEVGFFAAAFDINGEICYFDWQYANVRYQLPCLFWNEEDQQLQVACTNYTGTGLNAQGLYIIRKDENDKWVSTYYGFEQYSEDLLTWITRGYDDETNTIILYETYTGEEITSGILPDDVSTTSLVDKDPVIGEFVSFELGETITMTNVSLCYYGINLYAVLYPDIPSLKMKIVFDSGIDGEVTIRYESPIEIVDETEE